ncbi:MAG: thiamine phosphate synthase [Opitutales bacterium]
MMIPDQEPKLIVISSPNQKDQEVSLIQDLFDAGLWRLHLRKPNWSADQMRSLLSSLAEDYLSRIVVHRRRELMEEFPLAGYHLSSTETYPTEKLPGSLSRSFHDLDPLENFREQLDYAFLGPIFDSVSKQGYASAFEPSELRSFFRKRRQRSGPHPMTFALGGIIPDRVRVCLGLGFDGVAALGGVWASRSPAKNLHRYLAAYPWSATLRTG